MRPRELSLIFALAICGAGTVSASQIILPNDFSASEGSAELLGPLANVDRTIQLAFDDSQLTSLPTGSAITAIGFRLNAAQPDRPGIEHTFSAFDVQLSGSLNPVGALSANFADNIAGDAVTVRSGPYTLPVNSLPGGAGPNAFFFVPFSTAYVYAGGDLMITIRQNATGGSLFVVDAVSAEELTGVADSVTGAFGASSGTAQFFNVPVTALEYTAPIPEPATWLLILAALPLFRMAVGRTRLNR